MSWHVPQKEHERVSETGVFPLLDHVSGTLCLLHYVTETSHLYSLREFLRHFGLSRAVAHSDCCFFAPCTNILTCLLISRGRKARETSFTWKTVIKMEIVWLRDPGMKFIPGEMKSLCGQLSFTQPLWHTAIGTPLLQFLGHRSLPLSMGVSFLCELQ